MRNRLASILAIMMGMSYNELRQTSLPSCARDRVVSQHPFDTDFRITPEQKTRFQRDGFVKLDGFLNVNVVSMLRDRVEVEMGRDTDSSTTPSLYRVKYDLESDKDDVFEVLARRYFQQTLTDLTENDLFLTDEQIFEIEQNADVGSSWHVGVQTFGYQFAREFGCTLWTPLQSVNKHGQRGGMTYVPQHVISGEWIFEQIEPAVVSTLKAKEHAGVRTSASDYLSIRFGILNSPAMMEVLESHCVEDDFEPGDALVFNKMVVHRSVTLGDGPLTKRAAHVMRFVDAGSHYDLQRAKDLDYPIQQYRTGLFPFKPLTRQDIEIAEAGAAHGDLLSECAYFGEPERRTIRRAQSPDGP